MFSGRHVMPCMDHREFFRKTINNIGIVIPGGFFVLGTH
jgi:hypothetical protein